MTFRLLTDFNESSGDSVHGLQRYVDGPRELRVRDRVILHDDGEEEALGLVEAVDGELVRVAVDWATFGPAGRFRILPNGAWTAAPNTFVIGEVGAPALTRVFGVSNAVLVGDEDENSAEVLT
jgi:hypothetical protein